MSEDQAWMRRSSSEHRGGRIDRDLGLLDPPRGPVQPRQLPEGVALRPHVTEHPVTLERGLVDADRLCEFADQDALVRSADE